MSLLRFVYLYWYWIVALVPIVCLIASVAIYKVDVPHWDQWCLVPYLDKYFSGTLTLRDLWAQHNEHRLLFPRIIMILLAAYTGWNISYELAVNILLAVGIFGTLAYYIKKLETQIDNFSAALAIPIVSVVVFSLSQWGKLVMGLVYSNISKCTRCGAWFVNFE